jgi:hypothetical protein
MAGALTAAIAAAFSGSAVTADPYFEYTTLLLPGNGTNGAQNNTFLDGSTNNFTITRNGNTTQGTFSPFSQTGWGNYFDGTGDYLSLANNAAFNFGTGDFTIEAWVSIPSTPATDARVYSYQVSSSTVIKFAIDSSRKLAVFLRGNGGTLPTVYTSTNAISVGEWAHIALTRSGTTGRIFVNGNLEETQTGQSQDLTASVPVYIGTFDGVSDNFTGYISNLRVVKGVAVYTGNFTPPTSPLAATQSAGTNISAITGTQTSLLTCQSNRFIDNSTNNFTITRNGDVRVVAFSPFNPTASWSAATYGGSGYFDGSGDYLSMTSGTSLGSGDFTISAWVYLTAAPSTETTVGSSYNYYTTGNNGNFVFRVGTSSLWASFDGQSNVASISGSYTWQLNTWIYMSWVRSGSTVTVYRDGVSLGSTTDTKTLSNTANGYVIGSGRVNGSIASPLTGYISDLRVVVGSAITTVPTAPLTAITNTSLLLNFTNAGIYDATSKNDLETVGNAQISTTQSKWGGSSMYFNATNPQHLLLNYPTSQNALNGAFTIDFWIYWTSGTGVILSSDEYSSLITILSTGKIEINTTTSPQSTGTISSNTWTYLAFTRNSSGVWTLYINGSADALSLTNTATYTLRRIGGRSADNCINGYLQDFRVTKGYVRTITTPTAAFPTL